MSTLRDDLINQAIISLSKSLIRDSGVNACPYCGRYHQRNEYRLENLTGHLHPHSLLISHCGLIGVSPCGNCSHK